MSSCQNVLDIAYPGSKQDACLILNSLAYYNFLHGLVDRAPTLCLRGHGFGDSDFFLGRHSHDEHFVCLISLLS